MSNISFGIRFALLLGFTLVAATSQASFLATSSNVSTYYNSDESAYHTAYVYKDSGQTTYTIEDDAQSPSSTYHFVATPSALTGIASFFTSFDHYNHTLVANAGYGSVCDKISEYYYANATGSTINGGYLTTINTSYGCINSIAAFVSSDNAEHAVVTTTGGYVVDYRYGPYVATATAHVIGTFASGTLLDVSAYQAADGYYHAIVVDSSNIREIYYTNSAAYTDVLKSGLSSLTSVGAFLGTDSSHSNFVIYSIAGTSSNLCQFTYGSGGFTGTTCVSSRASIYASDNANIFFSMSDSYLWDPNAYPGYNYEGPF